MIASIRGTVTALGLDHVVIETGGVGVYLPCPPRVLADLTVGQPASLATVLVVLGVAFGWMTPVIAALCAAMTEAWTLRAGSRLLRRVDLRVPMQQ